MTEIEVTPEHRADPNTRKVGVLVGVVGILLSVITIASHRAHTEAVIHRTESNDLWTYYQAKKIRENTSEVALTLLQTLQPDAAKTEASHKLSAARDKYSGDAVGIQKDARAKDDETALEERRALRFDIGEGFLELGLVLCSLYFLARKSFFPIFGVLAGIAGTAMGIWGLPALRQWAAALAVATAFAVAAFAASGEPEAAPRVEARSADLLAVGLVSGDRMTIHLSRSIDNSPVHDAAVSVVLRGISHPATVDSDGSYTLQTKDLQLPGAAVVEFQVAQGGADESLKGTLQIAAAGHSEAGNNSRQLWWWVLNFAVCIGFLWLYSRRRKAARD